MSFDARGRAGLSISLESTAQIRLLGRSTLLMIYRYSEIDDRATNDEQG
jgi:hypothetical protein